MTDSELDRATLAVIKRDVASLDIRLEGIGTNIAALRSELVRLLADLEQRTRMNELHCAGCDPRIAAMRGDLDALKGQSRAWSGINSIAAIAAGLIGYFRGP